LTTVADHEGGLDQALQRLGRKARFAELMAESRTGDRVSVDTSSTTFASEPRLRGVVFRVWTGRQWAEASTSEFGPAELDVVVSRLESESERGGGNAPPPGEPATTRGSWTAVAKRSLRDLGPEGSISLAKDIRGWAAAVQGISMVHVVLDWGQSERLYLNSAGARCHQRIERTHAIVVPIAMENGRVGFERWGVGGIGGLELLPELTEPTIRKTAAASKELLGAKAPPSGETDVLLEPGVTGIFAHESFGHGTEADQFVRNRSYLKPILGQVVGPEYLSIVDDGTFPGGWGSFFCDDEGHLAHKTPLIDHGRFVGALHDRETAAVLGAKATANTRRSDFRSRAFVRMTNTYVAPGDRTLEELVADVQDGVLLEQWMSGIEDPLGGQMQIKVQKGHRIEHGRITDLVGAMALSGKVLDFLKAIRGVGRADRIVIEPGFCGKGHSDPLPAGTGGVHLLSRAIVGPA
jgi:TldD protein